MDNQIPLIVDTLYRCFVTEPNPQFWPDYLKSEPIMAHGLWAFYQGLRLGLQISGACLETM